VLIDSRWTCKLADFGLVELRAEEQRTLDDFIDYYGTVDYYGIVAALQICITVFKQVKHAKPWLL
jgi:hypothetical protein